MSSFIYVFDEQGKDKLLTLQYQMVKADKEKHIYVFLNKDQMDFSSDEIKYVLSDILTF